MNYSGTKWNLDGNSEDIFSFNGYSKESMNRIKKEGCMPVNIEYCVDWRMNQNWNDISMIADFGTIDAFAYNTEGKIKVIRDSEHLLNMDSKTNFGQPVDKWIRNTEGIMVYNHNLDQSYNHKACSILISDEEFENLNGKNVLLLNTQDKNLLDRRLSKEEVLNSTVWNFLVRNNSKLEEYFDLISNQTTRYLGRTPDFSIITSKGNNKNILQNAMFYPISSTIGSNSLMGEGQGKFLGYRKNSKPTYVSHDSFYYTVSE